jgi:hypothetical protein
VRGKGEQRGSPVWGSLRCYFFPNSFSREDPVRVSVYVGHAPVIPQRVFAGKTSAWRRREGFRVTGSDEQSTGAGWLSDAQGVC